MLRLHRARFHQEGLSALERQDGLSDQPALLLTCATVLQLDDLLEVSPVGAGDAVLVRCQLDTVYNGPGHTLRGAEDSCTRTLQVFRCCRKIKVVKTASPRLKPFTRTEGCSTFVELRVLAVDLCRGFDILLWLWGNKKSSVISARQEDI